MRDGHCAEDLSGRCGAFGGDEPMSRAFVLSGGASLGAIQVGMLQALFERGIAPDLIVGTSAGAINGAFVASRAPTVETARELGEVWRGLRRGAVFPTNPLTGFIGFIGRSDHLVPNGNLRRLIARHMEVERLERMPVPLHIVVTDVLTGRELRLSDGPIVEAVMASAAIPGVFAPVTVDGRRLMDGGVSDNTPISHAIELGADEVYVLPTGYACALHHAPRGALAMLLHATSLLTQQRLHLEIELYRDRAELVVLPPPCPHAVQPIDFSHAAELIERALDDSRAFLDRLAEQDFAQRALSPAERLLPHTHA
jgi:NTE family protein